MMAASPSGDHNLRTSAQTEKEDVRLDNGVGIPKYCAAIRPLLNTALVSITLYESIKH
jgi:hypothetical protein